MKVFRHRHVAALARAWTIILVAVLTTIILLPSQATAEIKIPIAEHPTFRRDVLPILTRAGCAAGSCHAKTEGQNGFQLAVCFCWCRVFLLGLGGE